MHESESGAGRESEGRAGGSLGFWEEGSSHVLSLRISLQPSSVLYASKHPSSELNILLQHRYIPGSGFRVSGSGFRVPGEEGQARVLDHTC